MNTVLVDNYDKFIENIKSKTITELSMLLAFRCDFCEYKSTDKCENGNSKSNCSIGIYEWMRKEI